MSQSEPFIETAEAQTILDQPSKSCFFELLHAEGVPHYRFSAKRLKYKRSELEAWVASRRVGARVETLAGV